jgi:hypothetical protein
MSKIVFALKDILKDASIKINKNDIKYIYKTAKKILDVTEFGLIEYDL